MNNSVTFKAIGIAIVADSPKVCRSINAKIAYCKAFKEISECFQIIHKAARPYS